MPGGWRLAGTIEDERLLNLYYNAADAFALPSLEDNLPNTLLEAMAAGTPCVTFDVGGCGEVVKEGVTGYTARAGDAADLADRVVQILSASSEERDAMALACRERAVKCYALSVQAHRYADLLDRPSGTAKKG